MVNENMFISIIIPCYNNSKYIVNTLESIINQEFYSYEIVIIDDGSTDDSIEKAINLLKNKKNINFKILKQDNKGVSAARNIGIKHANGKYIMFLDSDDYLDKNYLNLMCNIASSKDADMVFCGFKKINENNNIVFEYDEKFKYTEGCIDGITTAKMMLSEKIWICTGSAIFRTSCIKNNNIKYTEGCCNGEDQEFHIKLILNMDKIYCLKLNLLNYLQNNSSITYKFDIRKLQVLGAMRRLKNTIINTTTENQLVNLIESKFIKEFINNISCMSIEKAGIHELNNKLLFNKSFRKRLINYSVMNISIYEINIKLTSIILGINKPMYFKLRLLKIKIKEILNKIKQELKIN